MNSSGNRVEAPREEALTPAQQRARERRKIHAVLNVLLIVYLPAMLIALIFVRERLLLAGAMVADAGLFMLINGIWLLASGHPFFLLKRPWRRKTMGWLFLCCGVVAAALAAYIIVKAWGL